MGLSGRGVPWVGSDHSIVSLVDVSMPLICFHRLLTVFGQVRALIFSLEMETESNQKCPGITDEGLTLEVHSAISLRRRRGEPSQGLCFRVST